MPDDDGVAVQVGHVDGLAFCLDVRVLPHHEPADMTKEETPRRVVRVGVRVGELVVCAVVADPLINVILEQIGGDSNRSTLVEGKIRNMRNILVRKPERVDVMIILK